MVECLASAAPLTHAVRPTATFPSVLLPTQDGAIPIEVHLVARLSHGAGTQLFYQTLSRQRQHARFVDALEEPSAKLGGSDFAKGDATALYSFSVGRGGHPFHRHAGHRVFTAVSGSGGTLLRFSSATPREIEQDPANFVRMLRHVELPGDCLFTVRFSGENWHQFMPLQPGSAHPAFFALSTHTNELGGVLSAALQRQVMTDMADIPSLTQLLPESAVRLLHKLDTTGAAVPRTVLSLNERPGGKLEFVCKRFRSVVGHLRGWFARLSVHRGFFGESHRTLVRQHTIAPDCLVLQTLVDCTVHHEDCFTISTVVEKGQTADALLGALLEGFLRHPHFGVSRLMALRNILVRPLRLRTSPLACPVSSLASGNSPFLFRGRYPVHLQHVSDDGRTAQVVLGADDRHLAFRSCVAVRMEENDGAAVVSLSTRVYCSNLFGRAYMRLISAVHRRYIVPRLLEAAVESISPGTAQHR